MLILKPVLIFHIIDRELKKKKPSLNIDSLLFFGKISSQTQQLSFLTTLLFCFAEDFLVTDGLIRRDGVLSQQMKWCSGSFNFKRGERPMVLP